MEKRGSIIMANTELFRLMQSVRGTYDDGYPNDSVDAEAFRNKTIITISKDDPDVVYKRMAIEHFKDCYRRSKIGTYDSMIDTSELFESSNNESAYTMEDYIQELNEYEKMKYDTADQTEEDDCEQTQTATIKNSKSEKKKEEKESVFGVLHRALINLAKIIERYTQYLLNHCMDDFL